MPCTYPYGWPWVGRGSLCDPEHETQTGTCSSLQPRGDEMLHTRNRARTNAARAVSRLLALGAAVVIPLLQPGFAIAASETMPVWRAQVRFETDGGSDMGTDDDVQVSLSNDNATWIDYARDDFEAGDDFTYDLLLTNVRTLGDVRHLAVRKTGDDGWCIDNMTLLINGQPIYYVSFEGTYTRCRWMDSDQWGILSFTISGSTLRAHRLWHGFQGAARPTRITRTEFESRIQAVVGNWIEGGDDRFKWGHLYGSRYVEAMPVDPRTIRVDLDMTRIYNNLPDGEADGDFDMRFTCSGGRLSLTIPEVYIWENPPPPLLNTPPFPMPDLRDQLRANLSAPLVALNTPLGTTNGQCPSILVDGGGNLIIPQNPLEAPGPAPVYP
jgi:hypothetical protein